MLVHDLLYAVAFYTYTPRQGLLIYYCIRKLGLADLANIIGDLWSKAALAVILLDTRSICFSYCFHCTGVSRDAVCFLVY
jgi:hypothetical protein